GSESWVRWPQSERPSQPEIEAGHAALVQPRPRTHVVKQQENRCGANAEALERRDRSLLLCGPSVAVIESREFIKEKARNAIETQLRSSCVATRFGMLGCHRVPTKGIPSEWSLRYRHPRAFQARAQRRASVHE